MPPPDDATPALQALRRQRHQDVFPVGEVNRLARLAAQLFHVPIAVINLIDGNDVWYAAAHGLDVTARPDALPCVDVVSSGQALTIADMQRDERTATHSLVTRDRLRFYASVPLVTAHGARLGTLCLLSPDARTLTAEERALLHDLAAIVVDTLHAHSVILELEETRAHINALAYRDSLTGLPNRAFLMEHLEVTCAYGARHQSTFAVMLLDLDRFKAVNDTLGHAVGDQLLRAVAQRLRASVRAEDVVTRFAGDEFVLILPDLHDALHAEQLVQALLDALTEPITLEQHQLSVLFSAGISFYPDDGQDTETLLRTADIAMYEAKLAGRGRVRTFNEKMRQQAQERQLLKQLLDRADFRLYYQPIVSLATRQVVGVEALLRWPQPDGSWIAPHAFLPLAEETDTINRIGRWVLHEASAQLQAWRAAGQIGPGVYVSVNLSERQWRRADLPAQVRQLLIETGLPPECLVLEVPEVTLTSDEDAMGTITQALAALGVRVAVDGFGAGYSNLSKMRTMQLGQLKMDRSFVEPLGAGGTAGTLAQGIIALGHGLNVPVVAKGVETQAQYETLQALGCDVAQGYWFGEPAPAQACTFLLSSASSGGGEGAAH